MLEDGNRTNSQVILTSLSLRRLYTSVTDVRAVTDTPDVPCTRPAPAPRPTRTHHAPAGHNQNKHRAGRALSDLTFQQPLSGKHQSVLQRTKEYYG